MQRRSLLRIQIKLIRFYKRLGLSENRIFFFLSIVIGALCGLIAVGFHLLTRGLTRLCFGVDNADSLEVVHVLRTNRSNDRRVPGGIGDDILSSSTR